MSRKILFFINPISGTRSKLQLERKIIKKCYEQNVGFEMLLTAEDGNYSFLKEKIKKDKFTDIVICGGDGKNKFYRSHKGILQERAWRSRQQTFYAQ